jgi:hypothetical protein
MRYAYLLAGPHHVCFNSLPFDEYTVVAAEVFDNPTTEGVLVNSGVKP